MWGIIGITIVILLFAVYVITPARSARLVKPGHECATYSVEKDVNYVPDSMLLPPFTKTDGIDKIASGLSLSDCMLIGNKHNYSRITIVPGGERIGAYTLYGISNLSLPPVPTLSNSGIVTLNSVPSTSNIMANIYDLVYMIRHWRPISISSTCVKIPAPTPK